MTVVTRDHLHYARVLMASLRQVHPDLPVFVCLVDRPPQGAEAAVDSARYLLAEELGIPGWPRFAFQYLPFELACSLKPHALRHVLALGFEQVLYLDADIEVYQSLESLYRQLQDCNLILTPHLLSPLPDDGKRPNESLFLLSGVFNAGFLGLRNGQVATAFLRWWTDKVGRSCIIDQAGGLSCDQRWLDLAVGLFEGVHIERRPGFNVGHWTFSQSRFSLASDGQILVDGHPLVFFHFSSFSPASPLDIYLHQDRVALDDLPGVGRLLAEYFQRLDACGRRECEAWGYGYATLTDGTPIQPLWREAVRIGHRLLADVVDPFDPARMPGLIRRFRRANRHLKVRRAKQIVKTGWELWWLRTRQ